MKFTSEEARERPQRYAHYLYRQRLDEILDLEILRMSFG